MKTAKGFKRLADATSWAGTSAVATRRGATLTATVTGATQLSLVAAPGRPAKVKGGVKGGVRGKQGKVAVCAGSERIGVVSLTRGSGATTVLTLKPLAAAYTGPVRIVSLTDEPVRIDGLGWS